MSRHRGHPVRLLSPLGRFLPQSIPEAIGLLGVAGVPIVATSPAGDSSRCALRAAVGLACPVCGGTHAASALLSLDPAAAVAASPLVSAVAAVGVVMLVVYGLRRLGAMSPAAVWSRRMRVWAIAGWTAALVATAAYATTRA